MTASHSPTDSRQLEQDVDHLVHASTQSHSLNVPGVGAGEMAEIVNVTGALADLRDAERRLTESARAVLNVSAQEMRALQHLVAAKQQGRSISPSMLAQYLRVSAASMTKLLNKLERGEHISRLLNPHDRRGLQIEVSPRTQALVQRSVGRQQARRFNAASQLTSLERLVVARFLEELTNGIAADQKEWMSGGTTDLTGWGPASRLHTQPRQ